jgi:Co/Zn/Cd efflux system component
VAASAHIVVEGELTVHDAQETIDKISLLLEAEFGIGHVTVQTECHECADEHHVVTAGRGGVSDSGA